MKEYTKRQRVMQTLVCTLIVLVFLFIDLFTKLALQGVRQDEYFLGIVKLNYMFNTGIAFGIAADNPIAMIIVTILTIALIGGMIALYFTVFKHNLPVRVCLAVILAGALGNLFDRLYFSIFGASNVFSKPGELYYGAAVRDFIDLTPIRMGICNIADFCITLGAVALAFVILFIGPRAVFPITKKWREEAKRIEAEEEARKNGYAVQPQQSVRPSEAPPEAFEEVVVFKRSEQPSAQEADPAESGEGGESGENGSPAAPDGRDDG